MFVGRSEINRSAVVNITYETDTFHECESALEIRSRGRINPRQERCGVPMSHLPEPIDHCSIDKTLCKRENVKANLVWIGMPINLVLPFKAFDQFEIRTIADGISRVVIITARMVEDFMVHQISLDFKLPRG